MAMEEHPVQIVCISDDNTHHKLLISSNTSLGELLEQLVPGEADKHVIESFGQVYDVDSWIESNGYSKREQELDRPLLLRGTPVSS